MARRRWVLYLMVALGAGTAQVARGQLITKLERINSENGAPQVAPTGNDDSFWVRLQGATTNTVKHVSGWVQWGLEVGDAWHEVPVRSMDDANQTVLFTVEPGFYNLEIAFREDGALLDAWMITKQLE